MKALRLTSWLNGPVFEDVPVPSPASGEVPVRVGGAGACHSDLHLMYEFTPGTLPWAPPFTLGHENAGWVHQLGDGVRGLEVGQPVAVGGRGAADAAADAAQGSRPTATVPTVALSRVVAAGWAWTEAWPSSCSCLQPGTLCRFPTAWTRCMPRR